MSNTLYNYLSTDKFDSSNATLLLLVAPDHFSAAVISNRKVMAWMDNCPLDELLNDEEVGALLSARYAQVVTGLQTAKFTLWPKAVTVPNQTPVIARLLDIEAADKVFSGSFDEHNEVVFAVPQAQLAGLQKYNLELQAVFAAKCWVNAVKNNVQPSAQNLYLNVNRQQLDVLYLNEGSVCFYNHFTFRNSDEMVYYALLAAQQLELNLTTTYVKISGNVQPADHCISRLAEFFKGAEVTTLQLVDLPEEIPSHQILALTALTLCASLAEA